MRDSFRGIPHFFGLLYMPVFLKSQYLLIAVPCIYSHSIGFALAFVWTIHGQCQDNAGKRAVLLQNLASAANTVSNAAEHQSPKVLTEYLHQPSCLHD